jgi:UDPglucose 6-dehydrogenase
VFGRGLIERKPDAMPCKIAVVGCGYVGLTTGACFAHIGHHVVCADIDVERIEGLERGELPIVEPGLDNIITEATRDGRLTFVVGAANAVAGAEFVYLCVPTPMRPDGSADLSYIEAAAREIGPVLDAEAVVINKSTVPVGSTTVVERALERDDVFVVSNPEFLREGSAVHDFLHPDRIVIGATDQTAAIRVLSLYLGITAPTIVTDPASAETIKYAVNSFLATKISFANAMAAVCEAVGADMNDVVLGLGYDKRIGSEFLRPGPGWGGSCLPKDTRALVRIAEGAGYDFDLLKGVVAVNEQQFDRVAEKAVALAGGSLRGKRVAAWGLTFKARTDDLRESPALAVIKRLRAAGADVRAFDPTVTNPVDPRKAGVLEGIEVVDDPYAACEDADVLLVLTEWEEFRWSDFDKVGDSMVARRVIDARNLLDRDAMARKGFEYEGIGRR